MYIYKGRCRSCRKSITRTHQDREVCVCVIYMHIRTRKIQEAGATGKEDSEIRHAVSTRTDSIPTLYPHIQQGTRVRTHAHIYMHACTHTRTFTHAYTHARTSICSQTHLLLHTYILRVNIHTHIYRLGERVCTLARIRSHTRTNTHLHTWLTYMSTRTEYRTHTARHTYTHVHVYTRMHAALCAHENTCILCVNIHAHTQAWREREHAR